MEDESPERCGRQRGATHLPTEKARLAEGHAEQKPACDTIHTESVDAGIGGMREGYHRSTGR